MKNLAYKIQSVILKNTKHIISADDVELIQEKLKEKGIYIVDIEELSANAQYEITGKKGI